MRLIESVSRWKSTNVTRLTILTENGEGKIQVDLLYDEDQDFGRTAFIWDLYVKEGYRRQGIAKQLMSYALKRARDYGFATATLEWVLEDSPREIAWWYASLGFEDKEFSNSRSLMVKEL